MFNTSVVIDRIDWFVSGRNIGQACYRGVLSFIRYNLQALQVNPQDMLGDTVPHEVAHLVVANMRVNGRTVFGKAHGHTWKRVCAALGGNPRRTTDAYKGMAPARRTRRYEYRVDSGRIICISSTIHKKLQSNQFYARHFRDTREKIYGKHYTGKVLISGIDILED